MITSWLFGIAALDEKQTPLSTVTEADERCI
jgi:hypothetical protein